MNEKKITPPPIPTATDKETEEVLGLQELAEIGNQWLKIDKAIKEALEMEREEIKKEIEKEEKDVVKDI